MSLFTIAFLAMGRFTAKGVRRAGNILLLLCLPIAFSQAKGWIAQWPTNSILASATVVAAAFAVGELVARLRDSTASWDGDALYLGHFIAFVALSQAPSLEGSAAAAFDSRDNWSHHEVIEFGEPTPGIWRLVDVRGEFALVTNSPVTPDGRQFRLIKLDSTVRIHAREQLVSPKT